MAEVPDEMWAMIDRMREVVAEVWREGHQAPEHAENPYEGKESLARVFEWLA